MMKSCLVLLAAVALALSQPQPVQDTTKAYPDTVRIRMQEIEKRLSIKADSFEGVVRYGPSIVKMFSPSYFIPMVSYHLDNHGLWLGGGASYNGEDWLFMSSLVVLVGSRRFVTPDDGNPARDVRDDRTVFECCTWSCGRRVGESNESYDKDSVQALFHALGNAPADTVVRVRLSGSKDNCDFTMSGTERAAWRDLVYYYDHFEKRTQ